MLRPLVATSSRASRAAPLLRLVLLVLPLRGRRHARLNVRVEVRRVGVGEDGGPARAVRGVSRDIIVYYRYRAKTHQI
jgi:hypothetical protein